MLLGRERECARLAALIGEVRAGASTALVVAGEAGVGKTSLLEYAVGRADGLQILRAAGVASEHSLPFAGLADLVGPTLKYLEVLPPPQRAALAGALAVGPAVAADRFAICAATLHLLAAAAATCPVLAVVDDIQLLDAASAQAVEFSARRIGREAVGFLIAVRTGSSGSFDSARISTMTVTGLDDPAAMKLLAGTGREITPLVAEQLVSGTGGNPLALLELSATLTDAERTGVISLSDPLPVAAALQRAFTQRLDSLGVATRRLLVLVSCDATGDLAALHRASRALSLELADLSAAEDAGLVRISHARIEFTHPLLRAAVYHTAARADLRAAHHALAASIGAGQDPIRKAWHLAAATVGPDENVASALDEAASAAGARNAFIAASRAHQRAAELTVDQGRQVARWLAAGRMALLGGDYALATGMLRSVIDVAVDPAVKADAHLVLAHATMWTARPLEQYHELAAEAEAVLPVDQLRAAALLAVASSVCIMAGQLTLALETATRAATLAKGSDGIAWLVSQTSLAQAATLTGHRGAARLVIAGILADPGMVGPDPALHLLQMRCGQSLIWCEDYQPAEHALSSAVNAERATSRLADLPYGLTALSELHFRTGEWSQAYAYGIEAVELGTDYTRRTDLAYALACAARIEAAMGAASSCRKSVARAIRVAASAGAVPLTAYAAAALGLLQLGAAEYGSAAASLERAAELVSRHGVLDPCVIQWRPDYVETLVHLGRTADAHEQLAILDAEATSTGSQWAKGSAARCRGLLRRAPQRAIADLEDALAIAVSGPSAFEEARTRMCLGEALRRARQRGAARRELEQARSAFELLGARPWAERAAASLSAAGSGVMAAAQPMPIHVRLTPQELRVALQVAEGLSNQEVAARLFLSHKTIEVHLGHIYDKLGVHSRAGLTKLVHSGTLPR